MHQYPPAAGPTGRNIENTRHVESATRSRLDDDCDRALELISQRWTLQIIRDICEGRTRFNQIQTHLGLSRSLLTTRLHALMKHGIVESCRVSISDSRYKYIPTARGLALYKVVLALQQWATTL